ncbi:acyl--CoA ligase (plasmid) [Streptomyces sp. NBC_00876]|uniref:class I adenylate-forming enzyme family protein n=1 Tax=Streptomyces sp. NBC_00876 TaxID=2975853 RepID=UPI00386D0ACC|nr:acyl--CoA ligase [Streptomyces sp. NBC_00876]
MAVLRHLDSPLDGLLRRAAERFGDRPALTTPAGTLSFAELDREADRIARGIRRTVRQADAAVVAACTLDADFPAVYFGTVRSGKVLVLADPSAGPAAVHDVCTAAGAEIAFLPAPAAGRLTGNGALPSGPHTVIATGDATGHGPGTAMRALLDAGSGPAPSSAFTDADAVACVQRIVHPTAGVRELRLTHRNLLANAAQTAIAHGLDADSIVVNHMQAYHPSLLAAAVHAGAEQVLVADPDPCAGMTASRRLRATHYYGFPARLALLTDDERFATHGEFPPTAHLRAVFSDGTALEPGIARQLRDTLRVPVLQGYGVGGLSALSHAQAPGSLPERGAVGAPLPGTECRVVDPDTRTPAAVWSDGEVEIRGPQVPSARPDGWLATGDMGYLDLDGELHLVTRKVPAFA